MDAVVHIELIASQVDLGEEGVFFEGVICYQVRVLG